GRRSHLMVIDDPVNGGSRTLADWSGSNDATCVLDFNRDGRRDVLAAGPIFGEFSLFLNLGGGAFARRRVVGQSIDPTRLGVAPVPIDADQDGDLDLAFGYSNTQFAWYEMGPSGIESLNVVGFPGNGGEARLTPLDLDGDGDLDLLHEEFYRSSNGFVDFREVSWFQSFGVTFGPRQSLGLGGFIGQQSSSVDLADIDADGINDLVILRANSGPAGITWFAGVGNGGYVNQGNIGGLLGNPRASAFKVCDIDGDGLNDIVTSGRDGLAWYRNFGNLLFGPQQLLIPTETEQLDVRDFDADGDIDIIVGGNWVGGIAIALANLGGVFGAPQPINGLISAEGSVQLEDVDGDGDLDALFTTNYDVWWSENLTPPLTGIGSIYCSPGVNNSTGLPGRMRADGSATVVDQDVTISALDLPTSSFGFFITSREAGFAFPVSNSEGALCVTGSIGRYVGPGQIQNSGTAGEFSLALDLNAVPSPTGFLSVAPGDTWHFQAWHRDAIGGQTTSNFTDAVAVTFQ
ncbi:VCBS repeat-containing protein, partial [Planctomycetota bacterium]|nr:VCBS repeat-containing protein [Planctomycetota bacterium]